MSRSAERMSRKLRTRCGCGNRALFFVSGSGWHESVRARRDHSLCFRCWRAALSSEKARQMAAARARRLAFVEGPFSIL